MYYLNDIAPISAGSAGIGAGVCPKSERRRWLGFYVLEIIVNDCSGQNSQNDDANR
jgi:hypothetical protein